jgi:GAF domain-containing protein
MQAIIAVPMLKENDFVGAIAIYSKEARPFTDKQIELLENFASQAVIAIENARLLNELRQRTVELTESLKQQTATADVLKVISRSQFDLQLVLDNLIQTATSLCGAERGVIFRRVGELYRAASFYNATPELIEFVRNHPIAPGRHTITARVALERRVIHVADLQKDTEYTYALRDTEPVRTELGVPMFRGNDLVGVFILYKLKVEPFTEKQIDLVTTFADQAVIAVENARLLNELRESLEQQTATSAVLQVISSSPGKLDPVFRAILANATRICEAKFGNLYLYSEGAFRLVASDGPSAELVSERLGGPVIHPAPGTGLGRMLSAMATIQIADVLTDRHYPSDHALRSTAEREGVRTLLCVPMIKEGELIGAVVIFHQEVRSFTDKQVELVKNFAAQAVIAIENARLLNELRESLEQQTATSDVLRVISSSPSDIQPVLETIGERAETLCEAEISVVSIFDGELIRVASILVIDDNC